MNQPAVPPAAATAAATSRALVSAAEWGWSTSKLPRLQELQSHRHVDIKAIHRRKRRAGCEPGLMTDVTYREIGLLHKRSVTGFDNTRATAYNVASIPG